jgi:hypothetical protein
MIDHQQKRKNDEQTNFAYGSEHPFCILDAIFILSGLASERASW